MTMQCPETDVLIDVVRNPGSVPTRTREHVAGCVTCLRDVEILQALHEALDARADLPAPWVDEIIERLPDTAPMGSREGGIPAPLAGLVTAVLAMVTTLLAAATLSPPRWYGGTSGQAMLALSLVVGLLAGGGDAFLSRRSRRRSDGGSPALTG